jgi:uncharacterized repeat protein (TIGR02543 family)
VALTATPGSGSVFRGWGGACAAAGAARTCNVTVNGAMNVSANFATSLVLSAKTSGGAGLVVSTPAGLNCGSGGNACNVTVLPGSLYSISATPAAGYRFVGWSGGCSGTGLCNVIVNASTTVQANFTK